jgi:hypothetical protein
MVYCLFLKFASLVARPFDKVSLLAYSNVGVRIPSLESEVFSVSVVSTSRVVLLIVSSPCHCLRLHYYALHFPMDFELIF